MRRLLLALFLLSGVAKSQTLVNQTIVNAGGVTTNSASLACAAGHTATAYILSYGASDTTVFTPASGPTPTQVITNAHGTSLTVSAYVIAVCDGVTRSYTYGDSTSVYPSLRFVETTAGVYDTSNTCFGASVAGAGGYQTNSCAVITSASSGFISVQMNSTNNATSFNTATGFVRADTGGTVYYSQASAALGTVTFPATNTNASNTDLAVAMVALKAAGVTTSLSASPTTVSGPSTGNVVTLTGTGTAWTAGTPGSPTFTVAGVSGISKTAQTVTSATSATITLTVGTNAGTETVTDPSTTQTTPLTITVVPLAAPTFSPGTSSFVTSTSVTITCPTGATCGYTTDGTAPTATTPGTISHGTVYSAPLTFTTTTNLQAIATQAGQVNSAITSATYTLHTSTTYHVNPAIGGDRYTANHTTGLCNGLANSAPIGSTPNQNCAFNLATLLWNDPYTYADANWILLGGDVAVFHSTGLMQIAGSPNASAVGNPCFGIGIYCAPPSIPSGSSSAHTRLLGENYNACSRSVTKMGFPYFEADPTLTAHLWGGGGATWALNMQSSQYVDVQCIELTDHANCGGPVGCGGLEYAANGIITGNTVPATNGNNLLQDVNIHGFQSRGIIGNIGGPWTRTRLRVALNGLAGIDYDWGAHESSINGTETWNYVQIFGNGCAEQYPIVNAFPVDAGNCFDDSGGPPPHNFPGYGDGVGTPVMGGINFYINHTYAAYNTQDGLDLGHMTAQNITVINTLCEGNMGGCIKNGPNLVQTVNNNLDLGNCSAMSAAIPGSVAGFNNNLSDYCRAGDQNGINMLTNASIFSFATSVGTTVTNTGGGDFRTLAPVGTVIAVSNQNLTVWKRTVTAVADATHLTINAAFPTDLTTAAYIASVPGGVASSSTVAVMDFNTFVGTGGTLMDVQCQGQLPNQGTFDSSFCAGYSFEFKNNISVGFRLSGGIVPQMWNSLTPTTQDYNTFYQLNGSYVVGAHDNNLSPQFISQPANPIAAQSSLFGFNFNLAASSPAIASGVAISGITTDYAGNTRANPPSMGALQFMGSPAASSFILSGGIRISGGIVIH
jgi:hypothetical protein